MVGVISFQRKRSSVFIADIFSQVVDRRYTTDLTQPSSHHQLNMMIVLVIYQLLHQDYSTRTFCNQILH